MRLASTRTPHEVEKVIQEQTIPRRGLGAVPLKLLLARALIAAGAVYLVPTALSGTTVYYLTVAELHSQVPSGPVRVAGVVAPDQLLREGASLSFIMRDDSTDVMLPVVYKGIVPDIFAPGIQVVVEGRFNSAGTMEATTLLAKCPSRFTSS